MTVQKVRLNDKFEHIHEYWSPKIIGELNGQYVKLAKFKDEFIWHHHDNEDELFFVVKGNLIIRLQDSNLNLSEGELAIIPRGVRHKPVVIGDSDVHVLLFEPKSTVNTGEHKNERTVDAEYQHL